MNVKRYFAPTAREALRALKEELGADAIVLSNRAVEGGVEILALPADAVGALQSVRPAPAAPRAPAPAPTRQMAAPIDDEDFHLSLSGLAAGVVPRSAAPQPPRRNPDPVMRPFNPPRIDTSAPAPRSNAAPAPERAAVMRSRVTVEDGGRQAAPVVERPSARAAEDARVRELQEANNKLMAELTGIRGMIERQLAGFAWGEIRRHAPARAAMLGELLEAGFSGTTARQLAEAIPEDATPDQAHAVVRAMLDRKLNARSTDDDLIDRGGVYALVGPTGVGKTTTTAKLAARCVLRHGGGKLALITTDGYRIGAQEQLRIYGRILGVPVFSVRDAADLRQTLGELRNKHIVLIDTMGMSQRDRMVAEQAAMLSGAGDVRRLLLLNATCRGDTLDDVVRAYAGPDLAGCIFTKVDEAASLAPAIDVAVRRALNVFYVTNGQRVPEDLHLPNRAYLLHRALREQGGESPWHLNGDEAGMMLAAAGQGA